MNRKKVGIMVVFLVVLAVFVLSFQIVPEFTSNAVKDIYNLEIIVPEEYKVVAPGENIWFTTKVLNLANKRRMDITLKYSIKDVEGEEVASRTETFAIETQASFVGDICSLEDIEEGAYFLSVSLLKDNEVVAESREQIMIVEEMNIKEEVIKNKKKIIVLFILLLILLLINLCRMKIKKIITRYKIRRKIKKIIKGRIKRQELARRDLKESKLPTDIKVADKKDEVVY